jgi:hypothetical protein
MVTIFIFFAVLVIIFIHLVPVHAGFFDTQMNNAGYKKDSSHFPTYFDFEYKGSR